MPRQVVFVGGPAELRWLQKSHAFGGTRICVTADPAVSMTLTLSDEPFVDLWDYLAPTDIERNHSIATDLAGSLTTVANISCWRHGVNLLQASSQDLVWPFELMLNAYDVLVDVFADLDVQSCAYFEQPAIPIIRTGPPPLLAASASLTVAMMKYVAAESELDCIALMKEPLARDDRRRVHAKRPQLRVEPVAERQRATRQSVVIVLDNGMAAADPPTILAGLSRGSLEPVRVWELAHPVLCRLIDLDPGSESLTRSMAMTRSGFETWRLAYRGDYPHLFRNPFLEFQFDRLWEELLRAGKLADIAHATFLRLRPSSIILGHDAFTLERAIVGVARQLNIPVLAILHGGLSHRVGYRGLTGDADEILVWNDIDLAELRRAGVEAARIRVIGRIGTKMSQDHPVVTPIAPGLVDRQVDSIPRRKTIVFLTAATHGGFANPIAKPSAHREAWSGIIALALELSDWEFVIKPHPTYDHFEFFRVVSAAGPPNFQLREDASLEECLSSADVAVMVNYVTTAAIEAMTAGVPVVLLDNAIYPTSQRAPTLGDLDISTVTTVGDLRTAIVRLVDDVEFRNERTKHGKAVALRVTREDQPIRAVELLEDLLTRSQRRETAADVDRAHSAPEDWAMDYADAVLAGINGVPHPRRPRRITRHNEAVAMFGVVSSLMRPGYSIRSVASALVRGGFRLQSKSFLHPRTVAAVLRMRGDVPSLRHLMRFGEWSRSEFEKLRFWLSS